MSGCDTSRRGHAGRAGSDARERADERHAAAARRPARLRRRRLGRGPAAHRARRRPRRPRRPRRSSSSASPCAAPARTAPTAGVDPALFTTDAEELVTRADVVVEVIGGIEPARTPDPARHEARRLASSPPTRRCSPRTARRSTPRPPTHGVDLYYEAAVAGAIPLLRPLRESLAGDDVRRVLGIVNGTTNYVLDKMDTTGAGFADAVEQAQALGYAEADPTADVEGFDAAAKAAILASLAFHTRVSGDRRLPRGHHRGDRRRRRRPPREMDCVVKLLAICERTGDGSRRRRRQRPRPPGDDPAVATRWPACARPSTPSSSRPTRPAS